jgi:hypothetical protein
MPSNINNLEILKSILENNHQPQLLDSHPWTRSLMVMHASMDMPDLLKKSPGQRLVLVIANLFTKSQERHSRKQKKNPIDWLGMS